MLKSLTGCKILALSCKERVRMLKMSILCPFQVKLEVLQVSRERKIPSSLALQTLSRSSLRMWLKLWLFKWHRWLASSREIWKSRREKKLYGMLNDWETCLTLEDIQGLKRGCECTSAEETEAWKSKIIIFLEIPHVSFYTLHEMNLLWMHICIQVQKSKKPHSERVICQPLGGRYWATPYEAHLWIWTICDRTSSWVHS